MEFEKRYYKNSSDYKGKPCNIKSMGRMGNWRSRWERYRDINNKKRGADKITKIKTKATRKDYIVTEVYGHTADKKLKFKITPVKEAPKYPRFQKKNKDYCKVGGKNCSSCIRKG